MKAKQLSDAKPQYQQGFKDESDDPFERYFQAKAEGMVVKVTFDIVHWNRICAKSLD